MPHVRSLNKASWLRRTQKVMMTNASFAVPFGAALWALSCLQPRRTKTLSWAELDAYTRARIVSTMNFSRHGSSAAEDELLVKQSDDATLEMSLSTMETDDDLRHQSFTDLALSSLDLDRHASTQPPVRLRTFIDDEDGFGDSLLGESFAMDCADRRTASSAVPVVDEGDENDEEEDTSSSSTPKMDNQATTKQSR